MEWVGVGCRQLRHLNIWGAISCSVGYESGVHTRNAVGCKME